MEILRKNVHMSRRKSQVISQVTLDSDCNVPDARPDVEKLVLDRGEVRVEEVKPDKDRISLKGYLEVEVLYASAGAGAGIQAVDTRLPFDEVIHMEGIESGDNLKIDWEMEDLRVSAINSRKLGIRSIVTFTAAAEEIYDEELARGLEQNVDVQQKNRDIRVLKLMVNKKDTFRVKEEVLLAGNQANIAQLLWKDAQLQGVETRLLDDQVSLKGEIQLFVLYEGENEDQIQWVSSRIPFSGMVDVSGCSPDMVGDIRVSILQKNVEAKPDRDGEERALQAEVVLELDLRIYEEETVPLLEDAYSLSRKLLLTREQVKLDTLRMKNFARATYHDRLKVRMEDLSVLQILSCTGRVVVEETRRVAGGLEAEGVVLVEIIYITASDRTPVCRARGEVPFTHLLEVPELDENCTYTLDGALEQISASMVDSEEAEVRATIDFHLLVHAPLLCENIREIQEAPLDYKELQELPGIVGCIVGKPEALWEIAKKYYTTVENICRMNGISGDHIRPGQKILVVKSVKTGEI